MSQFHGSLQTNKQTNKQKQKAISPPTSGGGLHGGGGGLAVLVQGEHPDGVDRGRVQPGDGPLGLGWKQDGQEGM